MRTARAWTLFATAGLVGITGCGAAETAESTAGPDQAVLGPVDGQDLPGTDLDRVKDGDLAPDFSLASYAGPTVTLSDFRGHMNVVLVFYRGHW
jgi:hypothetical protein